MTYKTSYQSSLKATQKIRIIWDNHCIYAFGSPPFSTFADDQFYIVLYFITIFTDKAELLNTDQSWFTNVFTNYETN